MCRKVMKLHGASEIYFKVTRGSSGRMLTLDSKRFIFTRTDANKFVLGLHNPNANPISLDVLQRSQRRPRSVRYRWGSGLLATPTDHTWILHIMTSMGFRKSAVSSLLQGARKTDGIESIVGGQLVFGILHRLHEPPEITLFLKRHDGEILLLEGLRPGFARSWMSRDKRLVVRWRCGRGLLWWWGRYIRYANSDITADALRSLNKEFAQLGFRSGAAVEHVFGKTVNPE